MPSFPRITHSTPIPLKYLAMLLGMVTLVAVKARPRSVPGCQAGSGSGSPRRHLWVVNHYAVTGNMTGGTRHGDLATVLAPHGWDTTIFASSFNHNTHRLERPFRLRRPIGSEVSDGTVFKWIPSTPYTTNDWRRYANTVVFTLLFLATAAIQRRPDVVLGSSGHLLAPLGAWVVARWHRVPFVLEIRDMWPDGLVELGLRNGAVIRALTMLEAFLYRHADQIIVVSDGIGERITRKGISPSKIALIPHGVIVEPASAQRETRDEFRERMGWSDHVVAIWAGGIQPMHALDTLIEAARLLPAGSNVLIVLLGDGSERARVKGLAHGLENVRFYDPVPKSEVMAWLRAADIGVITSRKFETFTGTRPRKIFDYMAAGLAIVCAIPGEAQQIIDEAEAGLTITWERPDLLAEAIGALAADDARRRTFGQNGSCAVATRFDLRAQGAHLSALLDASAPGSGRQTWTT